MQSTPQTEARPARTRNKRGEGGQLREDIVQAALAMLDETGDSAAITLRAVARRVGISAPSIYSHFPDRQSILLAALRRAFAELDQHLQEEVEAAGRDSVDRLLAICHAYLEFARARPHRYLVMFGGVWNAAQDIAEATVSREDLETLGMGTFDQLARLLEACVADGGRSRSTDPLADATTLWVAMHGLAHQRIVSTAFPWPGDLGPALIRRLAYLD